MILIPNAATIAIKAPKAKTPTIVDKYRDLALSHPTAAHTEPMPLGAPPIADYIRRDKAVVVQIVNAQKNEAAWREAHAALVEQRQQLAAAYRRDRSAANGAACKRMQGQLAESLLAGDRYRSELLEAEYLVQTHRQWHLELAAWVVKQNTAYHKFTKKTKHTEMVSDRHREQVRRLYMPPLLRRLLVHGFGSLGATRPGQIRELWSHVVQYRWEDNSELEAAIRSIVEKSPKRRTKGFGRFR